MSYLTGDPDLMLEVLAVLLRRAGGTVTIHPSEGPGPFSLMTKFDADGTLHLHLDETLSEEEARQIIESGQPSRH